MVLLGVYTVANLGCIWAVFRDEFRLNQEHKFGQALSKINRNSSRNTAQIQPKLATVYTPIMILYYKESGTWRKDPLVTICIK